MGSILNTLARPAAWVAVLALARCYSAEFVPTQSYQEYRRFDISDAEILYHAPKRPYEALGLLKIRDSNDPMDPGIAAYTRRQCKKIGADGAWILLKKDTLEYKKGTTLVLVAIPYTPEIKRSIGIVYAIPYAYKDPDGRTEWPRTESPGTEPSPASDR